jgi:uncharacterized protein
MRPRVLDNIYIIFVLLFMLAILNGYFFKWLNDSLFQFSRHENGLANFSKPVRFILIVLISPFFETYLFQHIPNISLRKLTVKSDLLLVLIPSILFGCVHFYFWLYALMAFFGGLLLNTLYIYSKARSKHFFLIVAIFHSFYNLYGYLFVG